MDEATPKASGSGRAWALMAALAASFAVYARTLAFPFIYDDLYQIVQNGYLTSWRYLPHFFAADVWNQGWNITGLKSIGAYYRPGFFSWLLLNRMVFGLHPAGWHLTSILLHVATTALVYLLAQRLTDDDWIAWIAALLFGVHPIHIESVAWIAGCTEPLVALFMLGSFILFLDAKRLGSPMRRWISLALLAGGLFCKETTLMLPPLVALWSFLQEDGGLSLRIRAAVRDSWPYFAVDVVYMVARIAVFGGLPSTLAHISVGTMILTWPSIVWLYLRHMLWPADLSLFYDTLYVTAPTWSEFVLPLLGIVLVLGVPILLARRSRLIPFCVLWVPILLVPVLDLRVFHWREILHDRYLYVASVGYCIALAWVIAKIPSQVKAFGRPAWQALATMLLVAVSAMLTISESVPWSSSLLLDYNSFRVAPNNIAAVTLLGQDMLGQGRVDDAALLYDRATRLAPNWAQPQVILAQIQMSQGQYADAQRHLQRATELEPANQLARDLLQKAKAGPQPAAN